MKIFYLCYYFLNNIKNYLLYKQNVLQVKNKDKNSDLI